jgi:hypothetical protein
MVSLFFTVLVFLIVAASVVMIALIQRKPLSRVARIAKQSERLWNGAELLIVLLISMAFAILFLINN